MKIVKIVVFKDDKEYSQFSSTVCEKMKNIDSDKEFCGTWGEIKNNESNVLNSISATVNHFIELKKEIIFGCCEKDYDSILLRINSVNCNVVKIDVETIFN